MSLSFQTLHSSAQLQIQRIACRPETRRRSAEEYAPANIVVFPLHGVFMKHHACGGEVLVASGSALFFNAGEPYRISHPTGCGDDCLVLEVPEGPGGFRRSHASIDPRTLLHARSLWTLLQAQRDDLEIETTAFELFDQIVAPLFADEPAPRDHRLACRRREQVHAAALALAAAPDRRWTLPQLAQHVHSSQFHLARAFREEMGESIHRYLVRARLASALEIVMDSDTPLTAIATQLNFATPSHFAAAFRNAYRVTPTAVRNAARGRGAGKLRTILTAQNLRSS
jgi:AraC family transcriptional regulator